MEESTTYQAIIEKGIARGMTRGIKEGETRGITVGERQMLLRLGTQRFGLPDETVVARIQAIASPDELEQLALRVLDASSWTDMLGRTPSHE